METESRRKDEIFHEAAEIKDPARRARFVASACESDLALRAEIEELLRHDDAEDELLDRSAPGWGVTLDRTILDRSGADQLGAQIGPYRLLQLLGEGGMGVVYLAEQQEPVQRRVALKIIRPGMDSRQVIARFEAERQALALMDHPNIARVLDGGATVEGRPYFVMELVKGVPITRFCDEHRLSTRDRLALFVDVCEAVQHAHQKGIIHRDLKPSNILVAPNTGHAVVKVIDFGVAKATSPNLTEATLLTGFGTVVGTPEYMSPEQAELDNSDIDTRSDIYSLGAVLYELVTGATPLTRQSMRESNLLELLRSIREQEVAAPSQRLALSPDLHTVAANRSVEPARLRRQVRGELDWIVMKALEKDRARRYETANGFAADIRRFLADEPVQARQPSTWYLLRKFARRNRVAIGVLAFLMSTVIGIVGFVVSGLSYVNRRTQDAYDRELAARGAVTQSLRRESEAHRAEIGARQRAELVGAHRQIGLACHAWDEGDVGLVHKLLAEIPVGLRGWEWNYLNRLTRQHLGAWQFARQQVCELGFREESLLVGLLPQVDVASGAIFPLRPPKLNRVELVELRTGERIATIEQCPYIRLDSDGARMVHPTTGAVLARSTHSGEQQHAWTPPGAANSHPLVFARIYVGGGKVAYRLDGQPLAVSDLGTGQTLLEISEPTSRVWIVQEGTVLVAKLDDQLAYWDLTAPTSKPRFVRATGFSGRWADSALAFDPTGTTFATWSYSSSDFDLWNAETGDWLRTLPGHPGGANTAAFSPNGEQVATGGEDAIVRVWECETGMLRGEYRGHSTPPTFLAWSPDGTSLLSGAGGEIRQWDVTRRQESIAIRGRSPTELIYQASHRIVVRSGADHCEAIDPVTGGVTSVEPAGTPAGSLFPLAEGGILSVQFERDRTSLHLYDYLNGSDLGEVDTPDGSAVSTLAASRDGRLLAAGCANGVVHVWDVDGLQLRHSLPPLTNAIVGVEFSADGRRLAARSSSTGRSATATTSPSAPATGRSPSQPLLPGKVPNLVAPRWDPHQPPEVVVWETGSARELSRRQIEHTSLDRMAFRPNGRQLAVPQPDGLIRIFNLDGVGPDGELRPSREAITSVLYLPDGSRLITGDAIGVVRVWDPSARDALMTLGNHTKGVTMLACSPDGSRVVSVGGELRIWDGSPLEAP